MRTSDTDLAVFARLDESIPALGAVRAALSGRSAWLVGGVVRDLLLGRERADVDVVVEGDPVEVAASLEGEARAHERFGTVVVKGPGFELDLARARAESYAHPGALPEVRPGTLTEDLARRDFTANAMAVPLSSPGELIDPHGGLADVHSGILRVLHERSLLDDPTRAIRAARYVSRLGFVLDPETEKLVRAADLKTVSAQRIESGLRKLAGETEPAMALGLLVDWGLARADVERAGTAIAVARQPRFEGVDAAAAFLSAGAVEAGLYRAVAADRAEALATTSGGLPSALTFAARGASGVELVLARALGAQWIDDYVDSWRGVRLEIGGHDLLEAGVQEGPRVGAGLAEALRRKLDGEISGRKAELEVALGAARR